MFHITSLPLVVMLAVLVSIFSIFISLRRGRIMADARLSEPRCAKCNYDLRGFTGAAPVRCSECGADLTARHAILWGTDQQKRASRWIAIAIVLFAVTILPLLLSHVGTTARMSMPGVMFPGSPAFSARSNAVVIASLASTANQPWDWQELEKRMASGTLSNAEIAQAIDKLIAFLQTQTTSQPLSWADRFVTAADSANAISDSQYRRLAKAFYGSTTVSVAATVRSGGKLPIVVHAGGPWRLPGVEFVYALRSVTAGDTTLPLGSDRNPNRAPDADYLSAAGAFEIDGKTKLDLPAGDYVLHFTVDVAVLYEKTAPQMIDNLPGQATHWPKGRASWTDVIAVPVKVLPADQSPIALVSTPLLDPQSFIHIKSIRAIRIGTGQRVTVDLEVVNSPVPCSFDVLLKIAGRQYPVGQLVSNSSGSSGSQGVHDLPSLDASVQTADVLLRPDPAHAEGVPGIERIWGGPIDIRNVPVQRFDLGQQK